MGQTITFDKVTLKFSKALKKIRGTKGLSQGDIFRRSGLERTYISRLENGYIDDPRLTTAFIIARALGVKVDDLIAQDTRQSHV